MTEIAGNDPKRSVTVRRPVVDKDNVVTYYDGKSWHKVKVDAPFPKESLFVRMAKAFQDTVPTCPGGKIDKEKAEAMATSILKCVRGDQYAPQVNALFDIYLRDDGFIDQDEQFEIMNELRSWNFNIKEIDMNKKQYKWYDPRGWF